MKVYTRLFFFLALGLVVIGVGLTSLWLGVALMGLTPLIGFAGSVALTLAGVGGLWSVARAVTRFIEDLDHQRATHAQTLQTTQTELAQANAARRQAELLQSALYRIAYQASSSADLPSFYAAVHGIVGELMYARNFYIALYDETAQQLTFPYSVDEKDPVRRPRALRKGVTEYVIRTGRSLLVTPQVLAKLVEQGEVVTSGALSVDWLGVPLKIEDRTLGMLAVQSYTPTMRFTEQDRNLLMFVSQHIATALERRRSQDALLQYQEHLEEQVAERTAAHLAVAEENARLYQEAQQEIAERRRAEQLQSALYRIADITSSGEDMSAFYTALHQVIGELMYARNFYIALYDEERQMISYPFWSDEADPERPAPEPLSGGLTNYVIRTGKSALVSPERFQVLLQAGEIQVQGTPPIDWLGVPLKIGPRILGVLTVQSYSHDIRFGEKEEELLTFVSQHIATALERRRALDVVREYQEQLERLVTERTAELTQANQRLRDEEEAVRRQNEYLAALNDTSLALLNRLDLNELMTTLMRRVGQILEAPHGYIGLVAPSGEQLNFLVGTGALSEATPVKLGEGVGGQVWETGQPVVVGDYDLWANRHVAVEKGAVQAMAGVPLKSGDKVVGVLGLAYSRGSGREFGDEELALLQRFGQLASLVLDNVRLFEAAQRRGDELEAIRQASISLTSSLDLPAVLRTIVNLVRRLLNGDFIHIYMYDGEIIVFGAAYWDGKFQDRPFTEPRPGGSTYGIARRAEAIVAPNMETHPAFAGSGMIGSFVGFPLEIGARVVGVLSYGQPAASEFSDDELRLLRLLADQAAIAIEHARLYAASQEELVERERTAEALRQSEARYRTILENIEDGYYEFDLLGFLTLCNDSFCRITGYPRDQIMGTNVRRYIDEETTHILTDTFERVRQTGIPVPEVVFHFTRRDGLWRFVAASVALIQNVMGEHLGFRGIMRDITERKEAEETLHRAHDELERRVEQLDLINRVGRYATSQLNIDALLPNLAHLIRASFNYYAVMIFLVERTVGDFIRLSAAATTEAIDLLERGLILPVAPTSGFIGQVVASGEPLLVEDVLADARYLPDDRLPRTRSELLLPLQSSNQVLGVLELRSVAPGAFFTEDVQVFQTLADQIAVAMHNALSFKLAQSARAEAEAANKLKSQFLANMSHELRTPLNSIINFAYLIGAGTEGPLTTTQEDFINRIGEAGRHLLGLINDILDLAKIESGKLELFLEEVDIEELIEGVASTAIGLLHDKPIELRRDIPEHLPRVRADHTRIRQVLLNLLSNAAKFTQHGHITIRVWTDAQWLTVSVADTGIGMPTDDVPKAFAEFVQLDGSLTRQAGGTGLGLPISRRFVELHGGQMWGESQLGKGSTFYFTLPLQSGEVITPSTIAPRRASPSEAPLKLPFEARVLIIDDDPSMREVIAHQLARAQGYEVVELSDSRVAVEQVRAVRPDVVILDVMMPYQNGWQILQKLRADPQTKDVPVVICSVLREEQLALSLAADDYLIKPVEQEALRMLVERFAPPGGRVLAVDDDPNALDVVRHMLSGETYQLSTAQDGLTGLTLARMQPPDVIVLDLMMPGMSGLDVIAELRADPLTAQVPVVVVTAKDLEVAERVQLQSAAATLLHKGRFTPDELNSAVRRAVAQKSMTPVVMSES